MKCNSCERDMLIRAGLHIQNRSYHDILQSISKATNPTSLLMECPWCGFKNKLVVASLSESSLDTIQQTAINSKIKPGMRGHKFKNNHDKIVHLAIDIADKLIKLRKDHKILNARKLACEIETSKVSDFENVKVLSWFSSFLSTMIKYLEKGNVEQPSSDDTEV